MAVLVLLIGISVAAVGARNAPQADARPINPYVPCPQWQEMHPGWPCFGNFPEIEEPSVPGPSAPGLPGPQALIPTTPPTGTPAPPPAAALTPPAPVPAPDPCQAIIPVEGYVPPALPGNVPSAPCSYGEAPVIPLQEIGLCPLGRNPDGSCRGHGFFNGSGSKVEIPDDYVYDPDCERVPAAASCSTWVLMHDYCSFSPDQLPAPGANADFRGPCARHDMCLENGGTNNFCNNQLWNHMLQNCQYTYGNADPRREFCDNNAAVYFVAVTVGQPPFPGYNGPLVPVPR
ncbi:hypothetical protein [Nocardia sp. XZ_19_369]|uniref:hypothetical protein n=1 Tax=Nocardia sp. XZ_19_369 TaxID=2769487 RepID=UPI00188F24A1|nr:hypothetical protein [Nocardia sp. XZ_19_369]